ncbi:MAG: hypothetical protein IT385_16695 [Deltaproteobacteria bacterium]|nr:hypothetical protein [Deltaproteobacteria bacterium]
MAPVCRRHAFLVPLVVLGLGACSQAPEPELSPTAAAALSNGATVSNVVVSYPNDPLRDARVDPAGSIVIRVQATLTKLNKKSTVSLSFTGPTAAWGAANLPMTGKSGDRYTFQGTLNAPLQIGRHDLSWRFVQSVGGAFGAPLEVAMEVTCSDGIFCNGEERYTVDGCMSGPAPCDDGVACTENKCHESTRSCELVPDENDPNCTDCAAKNCKPKCGKKECGDDGCGGLCTSLATDENGKCLDGFCVEGQCEAVSDPGTCDNPVPLYGVDGVIPPLAEGAPLTFDVLGDSSLPGYDLVKLSCGVAGIPDRVYGFTVNEQVGVEIRTLSADLNPDTLDTVIAIHNADCTTQAPFPGFCSDDAAPPGGYGSRVYGPLAPGSYRLIVSGFSAQQVGPFVAQVKFAKACVPVCDGKFCGDDGCGGTCGACTVAGEVCNEAAGRCEPEGSACVGSCKGRKCGDDGCGVSCGECGEGEVCADTEGVCVALSGCDHMKPVCEQHCAKGKYCGSDCQCHKVGDVLVDLAPAAADVLTSSIEFEWRTFSGTSCAIAEGCVPGPGRFLLMRFNTDVVNHGLAPFVGGDPLANPEFFEYATCHQHFHFTGFANFALKTLDGRTALQGQKLSYCMEDSYPNLTGPTIGCDLKYTCEDQGIQAGWVDSYASTLDCQWLILRGTTAAPTDIQPGWYLHETCTNVGRYFHEHTFDNNCALVPVYVPDVPDNGQTIKYGDVVKPPMP